MAGNSADEGWEAVVKTPFTYIVFGDEFEQIICTFCSDELYCTYCPEKHFHCGVGKVRQ